MGSGVLEKGRIYLHCGPLQKLIVWEIFLGAPINSSSFLNHLLIFTAFVFCQCELQSCSEMSRKNKQYQPRKGISSKFSFLDEYMQYVLHANKDDWRKLTVPTISVLLPFPSSLLPCFTFSLFPLPFSLFSNTFNEIFREDAEGNVELIWKDPFLYFFRKEQLVNPYIVF